MLFGEFRLSRDIDFVCPVGPGYKRLRELVSEEGHSALFHSCEGLKLPRQARADQYGVRFPVEIDGVTLKFELFCEARIGLDAPEVPQWAKVDCLAPADRFAEKLLANADRWADDSVEARDLIDLAMMRSTGPLPAQSVQKAEAAYAVLPSLEKAVAAFQSRPDFRTRCFQALEILPTHRSAVLNGLDALARDLGRPATKRLEGENGVGQK